MSCGENIPNKVLPHGTSTGHRQKQHSEFLNFALNFLCLQAQMFAIPCKLFFLKLVFLRKSTNVGHSVTAYLPPCPSAFSSSVLHTSLLSPLTSFSHTKASQNPQGAPQCGGRSWHDSGFVSGSAYGQLVRSGKSHPERRVGVEDQHSWDGEDARLLLTPSLQWRLSLWTRQCGVSQVLFALW